MPKTELQEGIDYYFEDGLYVFTGVYLLGRGYCCGSKCRHCPYSPRLQAETIRRRLAGRPIRNREEFEAMQAELLGPLAMSDEQ